MLGLAEDTMYKKCIDLIDSGFYWYANRTELRDSVSITEMAALSPEPHNLGLICPNMVPFAQPTHNSSAARQ
jgi:hypothetical protein